MQRLGRYEILGELGRGAMGVVYRAQDPVIGRTVAIKTIRLSDITDPEEHRRLKERLFREARSAGMLSHPHIVTVYDIGQEGETAYIAMEFVNGDTLEHRLRHREDIAPERMIALLEETASALDYAHERGIIHRDIKPANLMFNDMGAAKIADFGVAKIVSQQITQADTVLGTPSYMSPEQIEARGINGRADQFSLAVIAYQMLTGEKPFTGDTIPALMFKIVREDPPPPFRINASLHASVGDVLNKGLAKKADDRYPTCAAFVAALHEALELAPGWTPLKRGAMSSMPTQSGSNPNTDENATVTVMNVSTKGGTTTARPVPVIEPPTEPDLAPLTVAKERMPPPRRRSDDEEVATPSHTGKIAAAVLVVALSAGAFYQFSFRKTAEPPPAATEPAPVAAEPERPSPVAPTVPQPEPAATPAPTQTASVSGGSSLTSLQVESTPPGARVTFVPQLDPCVTPCAINASTGRYVATFSLDGHRPAVKVINLPQDASSSITLEAMSGTLMVKSTPAGAQVLIDGKAQGPTPAVIKLSPGPHKLTLRKEGLPDHNEELVIKDSVISTLDFNWNQ